jgi:hypothetical protein
VYVFSLGAVCGSHRAVVNSCLSMSKASYRVWWRWTGKNAGMPGNDGGALFGILPGPVRLLGFAVLRSVEFFVYLRGRSLRFLTVVLDVPAELSHLPVGPRLVFLGDWEASGPGRWDRVFLAGPAGVFPTGLADAFPAGVGCRLAGSGGSVRFSWLGWGPGPAGGCGLAVSPFAVSAEAAAGVPGGSGVPSSEMF